MAAYFFWYCLGPIRSRAPFNVREGAWDAVRALRQHPMWLEDD